MPTKSIPTLGDSNWGTPLNNHISQLINPVNGGINTFEQFSGRPTTLTADDVGKTYLYTQTGNVHQWTGTTWKVLNESVVNVKDYGAVGDGVVDDTVAIQFCLNTFVGKTIFMPTGVFITKAPLSLPSRSIFKGSSTRNTVIQKITNSLDSNNIDAIIVMKSSSSPIAYNNDSTVSDMMLQCGATTKNSYGIYANYCSTFRLDKVWITNCDTGYYSRDAFLMLFNNIVITEGAFGITILGGTSLTANTVYCSNVAVAYNLKSLRYSTFNSCAADGSSYISYYFEVCQGITLNSCGAEGSLSTVAENVFGVVNSNIIINAPFIISAAKYNNGIIQARNNSQVLLNNASWRISNSANKFIISESQSIVTVNEIYNMAPDLVGRESYLKSDKFVELTGGKVLTPIKQRVLESFENSIKSVTYSSAYPAGNNDYNENLALNLTTEINNLVGTWTKARLTFQGNDGTASVGRVIIDAYQLNGFRSYSLVSANAGATLVGETLNIPTIAVAGGGHWFKMIGIYETTTIV